MEQLPWLGVVELAAAIAARRLSPVEVIRAYLARIEERDARLRSYLAVFAEGALRDAQMAEASIRQGQALGPLHGVPVAVKDLFAVAGTPTTAGSSFLREPALCDCAVVARLRKAGAIILGKLNLNEFAYGPDGINPHHGTPWNPWSLLAQRLPGGSSSGAGVAVAAGLIPVGIGSDTGGSIRIPAACCGTVGLKPTYGRVSRAGVVPLSWSFDHVGPLTRHVADATLVLSVIAGYDADDPSSRALPVPDYVAGLRSSVKGLRIGLISTYLEQAEAEVQQAVKASVQILAELGCSTQEVVLHRARYAVAVASAVLAPEALACHWTMLSRYGHLYGSEVRRRLAVGAFLGATDYLKGQRARALIREEIDSVLRGVDCLLAPTLPVTAPPVSATEVQINGRTESTRLALTLFTRLFNLSGHPVVCLPCGFSRSGLPISMQLVGRPFDEATILRLAQAYEEATEWHRRRPPEVLNERTCSKPDDGLASG